MKPRGILFSGPMVRKILDGEKSETRRVVGLQPKNGCWLTMEKGKALVRCGMAGIYGETRSPYGYAAGQRLWVRETFWIDKEGWIAYDATRKTCKDHNGEVWSLAGDAPEVTAEKLRELGYRKKSGRFLCQADSRILLELVADVRVEPLQDITQDGMTAEGFPKCAYDKVAEDPRVLDAERTAAFARGWDEINAKRGHGWLKNPWVFVLQFKVVSTRGGRP